MSDTPRTDALIVSLAAQPTREYVELGLIGFARRLERENAELLGREKALREALARHSVVDCCGAWGTCGLMCRVFRSPPSAKDGNG